MTARPLRPRPGLQDVERLLRRADRLITRVRRQIHEAADTVLDAEAAIGLAVLACKRRAQRFKRGRP
jgi:hypothetical protein